MATGGKMSSADMFISVVFGMSVVVWVWAIYEEIITGAARYLILIAIASVLSLGITFVAVMRKQ